MLENGSLASYELTADSIILVTGDMKIKQGDYIAKIPKESTKTKDITGGLPRVVELFEEETKDLQLLLRFQENKVCKDYKMKRKKLKLS